MLPRALLGAISKTGKAGDNGRLDSHPSGLMADDEAILVITNFPDRESAQRVAEKLVSARLAACVNVLASCDSIYRWQGQIETATETPLLIKTRRACYAQLEALVRECHPYELPEIIAFPIVCGLPAYLGWLAAETSDLTSSIGASS